MFRSRIVGILFAISPLTLLAHDTWVETNTPLVKRGNIVYVDLKLGNHGNDHRDFKLASKIGLEACQISILGPSGDSIDIKSRLVDVGLTAKDGYWSARYPTEAAGLHLVANTVVNSHGKTRSIKSAKTFFLVSDHLDDVPTGHEGFDKPLGHGLEIVPLSNPVTATGPGQPIRIKVLFQSKPINEARVSFVPRGTILEEGFDKKFERMTDSNGEATYTPIEGNIFLVSVHRSATDEKEPAMTARVIRRRSQLPSLK